VSDPKVKAKLVLHVSLSTGPTLFDIEFEKEFSVWMHWARKATSLVDRCERAAANGPLRPAGEVLRRWGKHTVAINSAEPRSSVSLRRWKWRVLERLAYVRFHRWGINAIDNHEVTWTAKTTGVVNKRQ